eukprot:g610.t1
MIEKNRNTKSNVASEQNSDKDRIKCRIRFGDTKKSLTVDNDARIRKVYEYLMSKKQGKKKNNEIILFDEDEYEIDLNDFVKDYAKKGIAYFSVKLKEVDSLD